MVRSRSPEISGSQDDDIIELTDIVEKGTPPDDAFSIPVGAQEGLQSQMADLHGKSVEIPAEALEILPDDFPGMGAAGNTPDAGDDFDLEDLLGQVAQDASAPAATDTVSAPDAGAAGSAGDNEDDGEEFDLDALLGPVPGVEEMDFSQASGEPVSGGGAPGDADSAGEEELDLEALLGPVPDSPAEKQDQEFDLEGLFDIPQKPAESPVNPAPSASFAAEDSTEDASVSPPSDRGDFDLDALLNEIQDGKTEAPVRQQSPSQEKQPDGDGGLGDVDALLRDLVAPEQPFPSSAAHAPDAHVLAGLSDQRNDPERQLSHDEFAALFGDPPAADEPSEDDVIPEAELDEVLAEVDGQGSTTAENPDALDALLDSIMNIPPEDNPLLRQPQPAGQEKAAPAPADDFGATEPNSPEFSDHSTAGEDPLLIGSLPDDFPGDFQPGKAEIPPDSSGHVAPAYRDPELVGVQEGLDRLSHDVESLKTRIADMGSTVPDKEALESLLARVERVQADVEDLAETHAAGLAAAEARLSALEAEAARVAAEAIAPVEQGPDVASELSAFASRLDALEERFSTDSGSEDLDLAARLATIEERLSALETAAARDDTSLVDSLASRVQALEAGLEEAAAQAAARIIREEISALLADLAGGAGQDM